MDLDKILASIEKIIDKVDTVVTDVDDIMSDLDGLHNDIITQQKKEDQIKHKDHFKRMAETSSVPLEWNEVDAVFNHRLVTPFGYMYFIDNPLKYGYTGHRFFIQHRPTPEKKNPDVSWPKNIADKYRILDVANNRYVYYSEFPTTEYEMGLKVESNPNLEMCPYCKHKFINLK